MLSLSIENIIDNTAFSIQFDRILQNQYVNNEVDQQRAYHFIQNYQQQVEFREGQYFAPLPWKSDHPPLPSNLEICKCRLSQETSRLNTLGLMDQCCKVMEEHLSNGYIEELSDIINFYVLKDSETTHLRIFLAANSGRVSRNDCLHTGPCLLNNLVELLLRFRFPHYAFVADIQRALLHIELHEEDRPFVRFLWYKENHPNTEIFVYSYTNVVFGHTSSPMSLGSVLLHHVEKFSSPVAVEISQNPMWTISFPVLKTSPKQFRIFTKLVPSYLKAMSFYINGAQIPTCFNRKFKKATRAHSLPQFRIWEFLGTLKGTRFRAKF